MINEAVIWGKEDMISMERVIAVIPARGGSKSLPYKNITPLGGRPLIVWSIAAAKKTREIDRIIVSTDDDKIATVAREHHAEVYKRPDHLATDEALVIDALRDLIATLRAEGEEANIMLLLEPTCPFRSEDDIRNSLRLMTSNNLDSVATFKEADINPHRTWKIEHNKPEVFIPGANPWLPRQKLPPAFQLNGAIYAFLIDGLVTSTNSLLFGNSGAIIMPPERSTDINTMIDILHAESMIKGGLVKVHE